MSKGYGQFCPVAKAAEIITERWTLLVIRELLCGSRHFNDIQRGVPLMSPSLLSQRLKRLEEAGVVERRTGPSGTGTEYHLTQAGLEVYPVVEQMGIWGQRWARRQVEAQDRDPALLMWDIRRRLKVDGAPYSRTVLRFEFTDVSSKMRFWWLVVEQGQVDLCLKDPGFEVDLFVISEVACLIGIWMGDVDLNDALTRNGLILHGPSRVIRHFKSWFALNRFAHVERPA